MFKLFSAHPKSKQFFGGLLFILIPAIILVVIAAVTHSLKKDTTFLGHPVLYKQQFEHVTVLSPGLNPIQISDCLPVEVTFTYTEDTVVLETSSPTHPNLNAGYKPVEVISNTGLVCRNPQGEIVIFFRPTSKSDTSAHILVMATEQCSLLFTPTCQPLSDILK